MDSAAEEYADLDETLQAGSTFMLSMNFDKAINCYTQALEMIEVRNIAAVTEYELVIIKYALSNCYVAVRESEKAIHCICSITELYGSKYPILYFALAIALIEEKCLELAESVIKKGLKELENIVDKNSFRTTWPGTLNEIPESIDKTLALRLTSLKEIYLKNDKKVRNQPCFDLPRNGTENKKEIEKMTNKITSLRVDLPEFVPLNFKTSTNHKEFTHTKSSESLIAHNRNETNQEDTLDFSSCIPSNLKISIEYKEFTQSKEYDKIYQFNAGEGTNEQKAQLGSTSRKSDKENKGFDQSSQFKASENTARPSWCTEKTSKDVIDVPEFVPVHPNSNIENKKFNHGFQFKAGETRNENKIYQFKAGEDTKENWKDVVDCTQLGSTRLKSYKESKGFDQSSQFKAGENTSPSWWTQNEKTSKDVTDVPEFIPVHLKSKLDNSQNSSQFKAAESTMMQNWWDKKTLKDVDDFPKLVQVDPKRTVENKRFKQTKELRLNCGETNLWDVTDVAEFIFESRKNPTQIKTKESSKNSNNQVIQISSDNQKIGFPTANSNLKQTKEIETFPSKPSKTRQNWNEENLKNVPEFVPAHFKISIKNEEFKETKKVVPTIFENFSTDLNFTQKNTKNAFPNKENNEIKQKSNEITLSKPAVVQNWNETKLKNVPDFNSHLKTSMDKEFKQANWNEKNPKDADLFKFMPTIFKTSKKRDITQANAKESSQNDKNCQITQTVNEKNLKSVSVNNSTQTTDFDTPNNDLLKVCANLKAENAELKASIKDYKSDIIVLNERVETLTTLSQSMAETLKNKDRYVKTLLDDINNLNKRLTSGVSDQKEHLVTENNELHCYLSLIISNLTTVYKENFDSHLLKCQTMINDLEKALTVLAKTTTPTYATCFQQLQSWKLEFAKTQQCLAHLPIFSTSLNDKLLQRKLTTFLSIPSEYGQLKDLGSCLHDNYYACVSNFTKTIQRNAGQKIELEMVNRKLELQLKELKEPTFSENSNVSFGTSTPINLTFDTKVCPSVNNKPFNSLNEISEPSNPTFDLSMQSNLDSSIGLGLLQMDSNSLTLRKPLQLPQNINDTKVILQKNIEKEVESNRLSQSSLEVLNLTPTNSKLQDLSSSFNESVNIQPEASYVDPKANNCLFLNSAKYNSLLEFIKSRLPDVNGGTLVSTVYTVRQRCGRFSGKSKECILNMVKEELEKDSEKNSCCICLELYQSLPITTLPCMHKFHRECVKIWLINNSPDCPICRLHIPFNTEYFESDTT